MGNSMQSPVIGLDLQHIENVLNALKELRATSEKAVESLGFDQDGASRDYVGNIHARLTKTDIDEALTGLSKFVETEKSYKPPVIQQPFVLDDMPNEVINAAFGTFTTKVLGRDAWNMMHKDGLLKTLDHFDGYVIESLEELDAHSIQNLIEDFASNAHALMFQQRKSQFVEVKNHIAVNDITSIEEVMDYLTLEVEALRNIEMVQESVVIDIYKKKAIEVFEQKIQAKEITLNDVPRLLARYGLMNTYEFMRHIDESMQVVDNERVRPPEDDFHYAKGYEYLVSQGFKLSPVPNTRQWMWAVNASGELNIENSLDEAIECALSRKFPKSDWEYAIEKQGFEGSWDDFIKTELTQKHAENSPHGNGHYIGNVVRIHNGIVYQQVGRDDWNIQPHALYKFENQPVVGDRLDILYKDGKATVKNPSKDIER